MNWKPLGQELALVTMRALVKAGTGSAATRRTSPQSAAVKSGDELQPGEESGSPSPCAKEGSPAHLEIKGPGKRGHAARQVGQEPTGVGSTDTMPVGKITAARAPRNNHAAAPRGVVVVFPMHMVKRHATA